MNVKIIADSGTDLPLSFFQEESIEYLPLVVHLNNEDYFDHETIKPIDVYDAMRAGAIPKTSQISPVRFKDAFTKYAEQGQSCIYVAFSSELSGTYQTAVMMKNEVQEEYPDFKLEIIDSKAASLGHGLIVKEAARLAKDGRSLDEIKERVLFYRDHMEHLFTVDDLEYLYRGGRVSKTSAFVGTLLKIKPLLHVEEGKLIPLEKLRGSKKVLGRMVELMDERGEGLDKQLVAISHADSLERAEELKSMIQDKFGTTEFLIEDIGAVIGSHAGPGTIALFFLNKLPQ
ncbi:DegV family protein [Bacillus marinisedimentorum]|uniref:DegV family protein n=1 Tax=Bacillus marinisedimentorum TaxID=1821260 RepID=UPI0008727EAF|nr:DegV family protein [Bacillus marinisedimentorum]